MMGIEDVSGEGQAQPVPFGSRGDIGLEQMLLNLGREALARIRHSDFDRWPTAGQGGPLKADRQMPPLGHCFGRVVDQIKDDLFDRKRIGQRWRDSSDTVRWVWIADRSREGRTRWSTRFTSSGMAVGTR